MMVASCAPMTVVSWFIPKIGWLCCTPMLVDILLAPMTVATWEAPNPGKAAVVHTQWQWLRYWYQWWWPVTVIPMLRHSAVYSWWCSKGCWPQWQSPDCLIHCLDGSVAYQYWSLVYCLQLPVDLLQDLERMSLPSSLPPFKWEDLLVLAHWLAGFTTLSGLLHFPIVSQFLEVASSWHCDMLLVAYSPQSG